jgi:ADP-ribose pyrophosphatase
MKWRLLRSEPLLNTPWLRVFRNAYQKSVETVVEDYYLIERSDFVLVFAQRESRIVLVRQYRPGTDEIYLGLPAGHFGLNDSSPIEVAKRELFEETGLTGTMFEVIGKLDPLPGYLKSRGFVVKCTIAEGSCISVRDDEILEAVELPIDEVVNLVRSGTVKEMQAVAAILLAVEISRQPD